MYHQFFNFKSLPFENAPDARFFYASEHHREALAAIEYTVRLRKGIVLVTGDIGSGKTTICRAMQEKCRESATVVELLHGYTTGFELARHLLRTLGVRYSKSDDHPRLLQRLRQYLLDQMQMHKPVVVFVDEAQALTDAALEEIRLLTNFDVAGEKLVQLALVGQPELRDRVAQPQLAALRQRIVMAKRLRPMNRAESAGYIQHRLRAASHDPQQLGVTFDNQAIDAIYDQTRGIPRLMNVICDNSLLLAYVRETRTITPAMVHRVLEDMVPDFRAPVMSTSLEDLTRSQVATAGSF